MGELVERGDITREEGKRMLRFCVNGGPAFIISAVGAGLMGQPVYGFMLYGAHIAAALILGIAGRFRRGAAVEETGERGARALGFESRYRRSRQRPLLWNRSMPRVVRFCICVGLWCCLPRCCPWVMPPG